MSSKRPVFKFTAADALTLPEEGNKEKIFQEECEVETPCRTVRLSLHPLQKSFTLEMVSIPSLSLWSSIKIPVSVYGKQKTALNVPYVDACEDLNEIYRREEPAREMVNLLVPTPSGEQRPTPNRKKKTRGRSLGKAKHISFVTVPNGAFREEHFPRNKAVWNYESEDLNENCLEGKLEAIFGPREFDVPSIKPWTPGELDTIKKKYKSFDRKMVTAKDKKESKRRRSPVTTHKNLESPTKNQKKFRTFRVPLCEEESDEDLNSNSEDSYNQCPSNSDLSLNDYWKRGLTAKRTEKPTNAEYYENKLAELYLIELGLKT